MAEYVEVMKQKKRMCNSTLCCKCDIFYLSGENLENCPYFISNNPSKAEEIIMSWAAKHPEPVYPTWWEWLRAYNITGVNIPDSAVIYKLKNWKIPADIAQRLGIQPKEEKQKDGTPN